MRCRTRVPCILPFASLLILLAGCGRHGSFTVIVSPDHGPAATVDAMTGAQAASDQLQGNSGFFPLTVGNRWQYASEFTLVSVSGSDTLVQVDSPSERVIRLVRAEVIGGREYILEQDSVTAGGETFPGLQIYLRQDRTGLYEADLAHDALAAGGAGRAGALARARSHLAGLSGIGAARRAAIGAALERLDRKLAAIERLARGLRGAPAPGVDLMHDPPPPEWTRLLYPMHPGAHWTIRRDPLFTSRVEGAEVLPTPAGRFASWRIRIESPFDGPKDVLRVWYSRDGYLGLEFHVEETGVDQSGQIVGAVIADQSDRLDGIDLVRPGR